MSGISVEEESLMLVLASMFEKVSPDAILEVIRRHHCDSESSIDELLTVVDSSSQNAILTPDPSPSNTIIEEEEFEIIPTNIDLKVEIPLEQQLALEASTEQLATEEPIETPQQIERLREQIHQENANLNSPLPPSHQHAELKRKTSRERSMKMEAIRAHKRDKYIQARLEKKMAKLHVAPLQECTLLPSPAPTSPSSSPLLSPTSSPSPPIDSARESQLLQRIQELEIANARLENEKKSGMKFVMMQLDDMKTKLQEKDEKIARLEAEMKQLHDVLRESKQQESKLEQLLAHSKDVLVEGVQTLSRNVGHATEGLEKGWAKVQFETNELFKNEISDEKQFKILQKMKQLAVTLREVFQPKAVGANGRADEQIQLQEQDESDGEVEELTAEEKDEEEKAKLASLQSYAEEQARNKQ